MCIREMARAGCCRRSDRRSLVQLGEPTLFDRSEFEIVDGRIPEDWIRRDDADGTYQIDPPELADHGFYDRLFDGKPEAVERFKRFIEERQLSTAPAPDRFRLPHEKR